MKGKIRKLHPKGWGFITSPELKFRRIFFHWQFLVNDTVKFENLKLNMHVEFELADLGNDNYRAMKVRVIEHSGDKLNDVQGTVQ